MEIGLGLRPDLTGRGLGLDFFRAGVEFARERFRPALIVLNVAAFNERAIAVYERAGFVRTGAPAGPSSTGARSSSSRWRRSGPERAGAAVR